MQRMPPGKVPFGLETVTGRFAPFLLREVGSGRLARVQVTRDHDVKSQTVTRGMQGSDVRSAESAVRKKKHSVQLGCDTEPLEEWSATRGPEHYGDADAGHGPQV